MSRAIQHPSGLAAGLARKWTRLYTFGLPTHARVRRVQQIESDLWEHWADIRETGRPGAFFSLHTIDRVLRGAVADLLWRFQLEGPRMQLTIPLDRVAGLLLIVLAVAAALAVSADGYDTTREGFSTELQRLAGIEGWQVSTYTVLQILAGLGMVVAACVFYLHLHEKNPAVLLLAASALAAAGIVTLVSAALYATAAELADEWTAAPTADKAVSMVAARGFLVALGVLNAAMLVLLVLGVCGVTGVAARHRLVPRWIGYVAATSAGLGVASLTVGVVVDGLTWVLMALTFFSMLACMFAAGVAMLAGSSSGAIRGHHPEAPAAPTGA